MIKIQGGHEVDGTPLYVAVGKINGVDAIGKVSNAYCKKKKRD